MGSPSSIAADEAKWRARDDMHTLARAQEIRKDKKRFAAARKAAVEELDNLKKSIDNTEAVAADKK